jgi:hypothetical protein
MNRPAENAVGSVCVPLLLLQCEFRPGLGWVRGGYQCVCRRGFYSLRQKGVFNGTLVEGKNSQHFPP